MKWMSPLLRFTNLSPFKILITRDWWSTFGLMKEWKSLGFHRPEISVVLWLICLFLGRHPCPRRGFFWHFPVGNEVNSEPFSCRRRRSSKRRSLDYVWTFTVWKLVGVCVKLWISITSLTEPSLASQDLQYMESLLIYNLMAHRWEELVQNLRVVRIWTGDTNRLGWRMSKDNLSSTIWASHSRNASLLKVWMSLGTGPNTLLSVRCPAFSHQDFKIHDETWLTDWLTDLMTEWSSKWLSSLIKILKKLIHIQLPVKFVVSYGTQGFILIARVWSSKWSLQTRIMYL